MIKGYYLPTKIYFGSGIINNLPEILDIDDKSIGIFVDTFIAQSGFLEKIKHILSKAEVRFISEVGSLPSIIQVEKATQMTRQSNVNLIIGIGGGSTLDLAKSSALLSQNPGAIIDFLEKKKTFPNKGISFVAIPTTAGTGSEATPYATIWGEGKTKYSLNSPLIFPTLALCDPELTLSLPKFATACTGFDALCQAIEAYWSIYSTPLTDVHSKRAISLAINNLENVIKNPDDLFSRAKMMLAAIEAGRAFSQTATTAVHSVSYPITAYFGLPHGYACCLTLSSFLQYNFAITKGDCNDSRGADFVKARLLEIAHYLGCSTIDKACLKIQNIMVSCGLETSLLKAGVSDIEIVIENGFTPDRVANNPRLVDKNSLRKLLQQIM